MDIYIPRPLGCANARSWLVNHSWFCTDKRYQQTKDLQLSRTGDVSREFVTLSSQTDVKRIGLRHYFITSSQLFLANRILDHTPLQHFSFLCYFVPINYLSHHHVNWKDCCYHRHCRHRCRIIRLHLQETKRLQEGVSYDLANVLSPCYLLTPVPLPCFVRLDLPMPVAWESNPDLVRHCFPFTPR